MVLCLKTIKKEPQALLGGEVDDQQHETSVLSNIHHQQDAQKAIKQLSKEMKDVAKQLDFEKSSCY